MACFHSGQRVDDHFVEVTDMIEIKKRGARDRQSNANRRHGGYYRCSALPCSSRRFGGIFDGLSDVSREVARNTNEVRLIPRPLPSFRSVFWDLKEEILNGFPDRNRCVFGATVGAP